VKYLMFFYGFAGFIWLFVSQFSDRVKYGEILSFALRIILQAAWLVLMINLFVFYNKPFFSKWEDAVGVVLLSIPVFLIEPTKFGKLLFATVAFNIAAYIFIK